MSQEQGYTGYYFDSDENPRILIATYNEEKARENPDDPEMGWYRPYGDKPFSPESGDVLQEEKVLANGDSSNVYYKVTLSAKFMEAQNITAIPPDPKYPITHGGWEPYRTEKGFFEQLATFTDKSAVSSLTRSLRDLKSQWGPVQKVFELVQQKQSAASLPEADALLGEARQQLQYLVVTNGHGLGDTADTSLPPFLPKPVRANDEHDLTDEQVWRFRWLYSLVLALHERGD